MQCNSILCKALYILQSNSSAVTNTNSRHTYELRHILYVDQLCNVGWIVLYLYIYIYTFAIHFVITVICLNIYIVWKRHSFLHIGWFCTSENTHAKWKKQKSSDFDDVFQRCANICIFLLEVLIMITQACKSTHLNSTTDNAIMIQL